MINPMIRRSASITRLQKVVYVVEKSHDHQNVSLRAVVLNPLQAAGAARRSGNETKGNA